MKRDTFGACLFASPYDESLPHRPTLKGLNLLLEELSHFEKGSINKNGRVAFPEYVPTD